METKLNNHGYVLVEIILASVIAFGIAYYMLDLTIKLKNKNDDLLVETLVMTDQAIIQNKLIEYMDMDGYDFECSRININDINSVITYTSLDGNEYNIDIVNKYTTIDNDSFLCTKDDSNVVNMVLPLKAELTGKNFDLQLNYMLKEKSAVIHYAFGNPTTSSPINYGTIVAQGHIVFVGLYPDGSKAACAVKNGELGCFKNGTSNWASNRDLVQAFFTDIYCDSNSTYMNCHDGGVVGCSVNSDGHVYCYDFGTIEEKCSVDALGTVDCGEL